tara:strand:- start:918 stop:1562 length:645 start_codon:yes stop_codon:yes gene_type:complete
MNIETVPINNLKPHPQNYKEHPENQLDHIIKSINEHGFYRNVVIAKDDTILAGHGVVMACIKMGKKEIPCIRLDIESDSTQALKVLTSDNEITNLAQVDDRQLSEILKEILDTDFDLIGTGFNEEQLSALVYTTRPATEIETFDEATEWVGMVDYDNQVNDIKVMVHFDSEKDRDNFMDFLGNPYVNYKMKNTWKIWYPERKNEDPKSIKFENE